MMSHLLLCFDDGLQPEEVHVVGLIVVHVGGVEDDLLEQGVICAHVDRRPRHASVAMAKSQNQRHLCKTKHLLK